VWGVYCQCQSEKSWQRQPGPWTGSDRSGNLIPWPARLGQATYMLCAARRQGAREEEPELTEGAIDVH
jgi:hypothetical protein